MKDAAYQKAIGKAHAAANSLTPKEKAKKKSNARAVYNREAGKAHERFDAVHGPSLEEARADWAAYKSGEMEADLWNARMRARTERLHERSTLREDNRRSRNQVAADPTEGREAKSRWTPPINRRHRPTFKVRVWWVQKEPKGEGASPRLDPTGEPSGTSISSSLHEASRRQHERCALGNHAWNTWVQTAYGFTGSELAASRGLRVPTTAQRTIVRSSAGSVRALSTTSRLPDGNGLREVSQ